MFEISANNHRARFDGAPPATDHRIRHWAMRSLMAIGFAAHAMVAGAVVPTPVVTGPIPGDVPGTSPAHNWPFFATHIVMSDYGYVEQEFFLRGHRHALQLTDGWGAQQHDDRGRREYRPSVQDASPGATPNRSGQVQRHRDR